MQRPRMTLAPSDDGYPAGLLAVGSPTLRVEGCWPDLGGAVAVVGARGATRAGLGAASRLARGLATAGRTVVSGGAIGIDGAAHHGALEGGATLVVLGSGLDQPYPSRNFALFERVVSGGAVASPFDDDAKPQPWRFLRRNRVMAALACAVVVVEADLRSGALSTARAAVELGRPVFAVTGSPGTDAIVERGAVAVQSPEEIIDWLRRSGERPPCAPAME